MPSETLIAPTTDIIAQYKQAFYHRFGELLTALVEDCPAKDEKFKMISDAVRDIVMDVRHKFYHDGPDGSEDYFRVVGGLMTLANEARGRGWDAIADRSASLVLDVSKIIRKITMKEEMGHGKNEA